MAVLSLAVIITRKIHGKAWRMLESIATLTSSLDAKASGESRGNSQVCGHSFRKEVEEEKALGSRCGLAL